MRLWRDARPLVLASRSRTRLAMLRAALIPVDTVPAAIDERALEGRLRAAGADPSAIAAGLAEAKAAAVSRDYPARLVLGADQTLELEGQILHKASDKLAARARIAELAGRPHRLHSAAALVLDGEIVGTAAGAATLRMRPLTGEHIALYADLAGEALTASVGAYAFEGPGSHLFEHVEGDHFTILGLPLLPLLGELRRLGRLAL